MDVFVLMGSSTNIPDHEFECQLSSAGKDIRLVVVDERDAIAAKYARPGIDLIIDFRRGNWDFFADHKTNIGFSGAVEAVVPVDREKPWLDEGKRIVLSEVLRRVSNSPWPTLAEVRDEMKRLSSQHVCDVAGFNTDGLSDEEIEAEAGILKLACWNMVDPYCLASYDRDRRMPLVSVADWMSGSPGAILFVSGYGRQPCREAQGDALMAAVRDHAAIAELKIAAVAYTDVAAPLMAAA